MAKFKVNIKVAPDIANMGVSLLDGAGKSTPLPKATQPSGEDKILEEGDYAVWVFAQPVAPGTTVITTVFKTDSAPVIGSTSERDGLLAGQTEFRLRNRTIR